MLRGKSVFGIQKFGGSTKFGDQKHLGSTTFLGVKFFGGVTKNDKKTRKQVFYPHSKKLPKSTIIGFDIIVN